jgi:hypothetical protein
MVKEVFEEHKLPPEFSRKILDNVPVLAWGRGRECTFIGALEAALAATKHPFSYSNLMGYSGLAFRVRWWKPARDIKWCPSCAVGEMEEEIESVSKGTGWNLKVELNADDASKKESVQKIIASLNAGKPVLAYDDRMDMAVVYGFDDGGDKLLFRDYHKGESPHILPASQIGWLVIYLDDYRPVPSRRDVFHESLKMAVRNWNRDIGKSGPGEYWYGRTALAKWREDLTLVDSFSEKERETLFFVNWWNFTTLFDARKAAIQFLNDNNSHLKSPAARDCIKKAASLYQKEIDDLSLRVYTNHEAFFGPWSGKSIKEWTKDVRELESHILTDIIDTENNAMVSLDKSLEK